MQLSAFCSVPNSIVRHSAEQTDVPTCDAARRAQPRHVLAILERGLHITGVAQNPAVLIGWSNPSIERTPKSQLRCLSVAAHVER